MKVGIKFGSREGLEVLKKSGAKYAEVYFRLDWQERYNELFQYLRNNDIKFGFHFWAVIDGKYFPNLVYYKDGIADKTAALIQETIDIAAKAGAFYVNYHPESFTLQELDLNKKEISLVPGAEVTEKEGMKSLIFHSKKLKEQAEQKGVAIYIETVPKYAPANFRDEDIEQGRLTPIMSKTLTIDQMAQLGEAGFDLCFDIGHVTGQFPDQPRDIIWQEVYQAAVRLAPFTKLIHVNTTREPLNGTDSHKGILEDDFINQNVFPNKEQFIKLMKIFEKNPDILLIPEPQFEKMIDNYLELKRLFV